MPDVDTVVRDILSTYLIDKWIGATSTDKTRCAITSQGSDFDVNEAADVKPFTVREVKGDDAIVPRLEGVGYIRLSFTELDDQLLDVVSGRDDTLPGSPIVEAREMLWNVQAAMRIPSDANIDKWDFYKNELTRLMTGLTINHTGPPTLQFRTLTKYPKPRRRGDFDDGAWRLTFVDAKVQVIERITHVGVQEVTL